MTSPRRRRVLEAALRRPRAALAAWIVMAVALTGVAIAVPVQVAEPSYELSGTESERQLEARAEGFGRSETMAVLLEGPRAELERQGPRLASALEAEGPVFSPWTVAPEGARLRPSARSAVLVIELPSPRSGPIDPLAKRLDRIVAAQTEAPVEATATSVPHIARGLNDAALHAADVGAKAAFPVLLLVLLIVFRSPLAAAVPALMGLATLGAGIGVIALLSHAVPLTTLAEALASGMGLALGVDYSLLVLSRFREELAASGDRTVAAATAARTAGRTVLLAGAALALAMAVALLLAPGRLVASVAAGVTVAAVLSVIAGCVALPAALSLRGDLVNRWSFGAVPVRSPRLAGVAAAAMRRPGIVTVVLLAGLLALAAPASGLPTAPPNVNFLAPDDPVREDFQRVARAVGPGQAIPFEITARAPDDRPLSPSELRALRRFSTTVEGDPAVAAALGGVDVDQRGRTARVVLAPAGFPTDDGTVALRERLSRRSAELARATGLEVAVGGPAGIFIEYDRETGERLLPLILAISALAYLGFAFILRSLLLPLVAVLFDLVMVGAVFGALVLLFGDPGAPLGDSGFLDVVTLNGIFAVLFAISTDYEIFLLARMREHYLRHGDPSAAILHGIERTGRVVTGAAAIMVAVFAAFALAGFAITRQFGVGMTLAVVLDAVLLRLLLMPAAMRLVGPYAWWLPAGLERLLGRLRPADAGAPVDALSSNRP